MTGLNSLFINSNTLSGFCTKTNGNRHSETTAANDIELCRNTTAVYRCRVHTDRCAHLGQLIEFDRLLKQALVLSLKSHFTDDGSGVPGELINDSRLEGGRGEKIRVRPRILQP